MITKEPIGPVGEVNIFQIFVLYVLSEVLLFGISERSSLFPVIRVRRKQFCISWIKELPSKGNCFNLSVCTRTS